MDAFQGLYAEATLAEQPDARLYSRAEAVAVLRGSAKGWFFKGFAAFEGDQMVGELLVNGSLIDNLRVAKLWVWVPPRFARRGIGSALAEFGARYCAEQGRTVLQTELYLGTKAAAPAHGFRRFAERHGYRLVNTMIERRLRLPVDEALLDRLRDDAAARLDGYRVEVVVGPIPAELAEGYCAVHNRLNLEMPLGEREAEQTRRTPEVLAEQDQEIVSAGQTRVTAFALGDTEVAGFSCGVVSEPDLDYVSQWATIVDRAHRGHRLGVAVKVALVRSVQQQFPDKAYLGTINAQTNEHMIAINEALGFTVHGVQGEFQRRLPEPTVGG
ncbi:MAG TPA: hypothetical protein VFI30_00555 [Nocardioidaceae bacterium]|nr:hypothetical protein [Nocardioidaceae bacterium]